MTRRFPLLRTSVLAVLTSAGLLLAFSPVALAQHSRGGGGSSGGGSGSGNGGGSTSGSSGGEQSRSTPTPAHVSSGSSDGRSGQASGHAVPRDSGGSSGTTRTASSTSTKDGSNDNAGGGNTESGTRPRDGRTTVGRAVARPPNSVGGGTTVIVVPAYGGYYPWAYGGLGFGGYYGYDDPGWYDPYPPVYSGGGYADDGALRIKVKPREASVYVDGYFAGRVDDFDGVFQRLKIDAGPHHVEVRLDGYETLTFDVRLEPDRTVTYTGELKKLP